MASDGLEEQVQEGIKKHKAGDFAGAAACFEAVIAKNPEHADAHHLLGLAWFELGQEDKAQALIIKALELRPDAAVFHHNLGVFLSIRGEMHRAEGHLREAIRIKPDYAEAFYNLSSMIKLRNPDPLTGQIEALLTDDNLPVGDVRFAHFAAGKFYDDLKEHDRAFEHYERANATSGAVYERDRTEALVQALRKIYSAEFLTQRNAQATETSAPARPVFIVGMPRSGTSLTEQILASHSRVHGAGELKDIKTIANGLSRHVKDHVPYPVSVLRAAPEVFQGYAGSYLRRLRQLGGGAELVVNKMPLDFWYLGLIASMFRNPVILHCRRDPLDTCLSCYFQNFKAGIDFASALPDLGHYYRMYHSMMDHWKSSLPVPIVNVSYEQLVAEPEAEARRIIGAVGLDWEESCAQPHRTDRTVKTASSWQVRQPVYRSSSQRWRQYERHLGPLIAALQGKD